MNTINEIGLASHTKVLASDEYKGRFPGTEGELKTISYISGEFAKLGIECKTQPVPLKEVKNEYKSMMVLQKESTHCILNNGLDFVCESSVDYINIQDEDVIFAGYGICAPEYNWNDYEALDVKGKIVIVLIHDPGLIRDDLFRGKNMTYYGRWMYKYEEAFRQGARGVFCVHNTKGAGYPWSVLHSTNNGTHIELEHTNYPIIRGWITENTCRRIFFKNYKELCMDVINKKVNLGPTGYNFSFKIKNAINSFVSHNIYGIINGHEAHRNELIIYSAHWDHFGTTMENGEIKIYSGARDNALSCSVLLELCKAHLSSGDNKRSIMFLFPTAEEQGLLGSKYMVNTDLCKSFDIKGVINFDVMNIFGATKDITFCGLGESPLDHLIFKFTQQQGRIVKPNPNSCKGMYFRSDHWPFAQVGIPSLMINMGFDSVDPDKPEGYILEKNNRWTNECYHKPGDKYVDDPNNEWCWDLAGAVQDTQLMFSIGDYLVNE